MDKPPSEGESGTRLGTKWSSSLIVDPWKLKHYMLGCSMFFLYWIVGVRFLDGDLLVWDPIIIGCIRELKVWPSL